jgi:hypothetical protein
MDDAVEASAQRVRNYLRRPFPGCRNLLMETAGNTVSDSPSLPAETTMDSFGDVGPSGFKHHVYRTRRGREGGHAAQPGPRIGGCGLEVDRVG